MDDGHGTVTSLRQALSDGSWSGADGNDSIIMMMIYDRDSAPVSLPGPVDSET